MAKAEKALEIKKPENMAKWVKDHLDTNGDVKPGAILGAYQEAGYTVNDGNRTAILSGINAAKQAWKRANGTVASSSPGATPGTGTKLDLFALQALSQRLEKEGGAAKILKALELANEYVVEFGTVHAAYTAVVLASQFDFSQYEIVKRAEPA